MAASGDFGDGFAPVSEGFGGGGGFGDFSGAAIEAQVKEDILTQRQTAATLPKPAPVQVATAAPAIIPIAGANNMPNGVGQSDASFSDGGATSDGSGTGVPSNSVFQNVTSLANAIATDTSQVFRTVNAPTVPPPTSGITVGGTSIGFSGVIPWILLAAAVYFVFKEV